MRRYIPQSCKKSVAGRFDAVSHVFMRQWTLKMLFPLISAKSTPFPKRRPGSESFRPSGRVVCLLWGSKFHGGSRVVLPPAYLGRTSDTKRQPSRWPPPAWGWGLLFPQNTPRKPPGKAPEGTFCLASTSVGRTYACGHCRVFVWLDFEGRPSMSCPMRQTAPPAHPPPESCPKVVQKSTPS